MDYTLLNVLILELKVYCGPDIFYVQSKFGQCDKEKNRATFDERKKRMTQALLHDENTT